MPWPVQGEHVYQRLGLDPFTRTAGAAIVIKACLILLG